MHALKKKAHPQTQTTHLLRSSKSFLVMVLPGSSAKQVPLRLRHMLVLLTITSVALCSRTDTFAASSPGKTVLKLWVAQFGQPFREALLLVHS